MGRQSANCGNAPAPGVCKHRGKQGTGFVWLWRVVVVADSTLIFSDHERPFGPMSFRVGGSGPQSHKVV